KECALPNTRLPRKEYDRTRNNTAAKHDIEVRNTGKKSFCRFFFFCSGNRLHRKRLTAHRSFRNVRLARRSRRLLDERIPLTTVLALPRPFAILRPAVLTYKLCL